MVGINETVRTIISQKFDIEVELIRPEMKLKRDLGMDSLDVVELIVDLEKEFEIALPEDAVENLIFVSDVIQCIEESG